MKNPFSYLLQIEKHTFFTALFTSILILIFGYDSTDFTLEKMNKLIISQATVDGVSIQSRVDLFYGLIFRLLLLMVVLLKVFSVTFDKIRLQNHQKSSVLFLSSIGISIQLLQIIGVQTQLLISTLFFILLFKISCYFLGNSAKSSFKIFKSELLSHSVLGYAFLLYFAVLYLGISSNFLPVYIIISIVLMIFFYGINRYTKLSIRQINYAFLPLVLFSILAFISVELVLLQYQKGSDFIGYRKLYLLLFLLCSIGYYTHLKFRKNRLKNSAFLFRKYIAPSVIVAFALLVYYFPIVQQNTEVFELGNPANALHNIFKFNEIPFVDFMSSHMFSEQWYGILYSLIFGFNQRLDFQIYAFFNHVIFLFVVYYLLQKLFKNTAFSLLIILAFPFLTQVFSSDLVFCILPFMIIRRIERKSTSQLYFYLIASLILLIIWRIDTGYAALVSTLFYFIFLIITASIKINWKHFLKGSLWIGLTVLSLLILAIILRDSSTILDHFRTALHYVSGSQAHGYTNIAYNYPHQFYISYFFLPSIAVLCVMYILFILWKKENFNVVTKQNIFILHASLFFFLISLVNAQRGIVRHGYAEHNDGAVITTFYLALSLLLIFVFRNMVKSNRLTLFYVLCFSLFLSFRYFPYDPEFGTFDRALKKNCFLRLDNEISAKTKVKRTQVNASFHEKKIKDFKAFLDKELTEEQTFLDFSNTPMLYYYTGREVPGYFCQNLQNSIDDYSQLNLLQHLSPSKIPVVVFSSYPKTWFDATDGIPNEMRYYLISEYIYQNYKPYGIISEKSIWVAKDFKLNNEKSIEQDSLIDLPKEYNYKKAAHLIHGYHQRDDFKELKKVNYWNTDQLDSINIQKWANENPNAYLSITFKDEFYPMKNSITLLDKAGNKLDRFMFETNPEYGKHYMIRVSNSYHWHNGKAVYLDSVYETIEGISLFKDIRFED
ncbi:hypothetical protein [Brumimicrobium aurantiacum]|uniref:Uncharacterized protein n=1 Tax=Brumimicrobium aurantiacum TaxID=1737063 RepID=A0A3E1F253_9FLAO|nr:hypothetical protein [Brumimicrobium aurantiacum]RFC55895.1 hypothetical protein DXU93_02865 [Brumimicrobium aurantiacum]